MTLLNNAVRTTALSVTLMLPNFASANEAAEMIRDFYAAVDAGQRNVYQPMIAEDFVDHDRPKNAPETATDAQVILNLFAELESGFPGAIHVLDLVEPISPDDEGNPRAMVRWTFEGTHNGPFFGATATGNPVSINGIDIFTARDGQFIEQWHIEELITLFEQIAPKEN